MWISLLSMLAMGGMFLYMVRRARYAAAKKMALIPMGACAAEILCMGMLTPSLFPVLTVVLVALRLLILGCCVGAMRQDAALVRRHSRRVQAARRRAATCAVPVPGTDGARRSGDTCPHCA